KHIEQKIATRASTQGSNVEFTKKEHLLFDFLHKHLNEIAEREDIIQAVWPEVTTLGVSDWAVDRLVARVRAKLKQKKSPFEIQTIKTRGYKLVSL
ncbi:MAG: helix-turn-helix domain-containing protein, partial [Candidatus Levybacteria bacterium]|nr:helix-turn-helix domain-containing protein [Candidatus Levybacteria bacterium]